MIWVSLLLAAVSFASDVPDFRRDVQPIFEKYCQSCHSDGVRLGGFEYSDYANLIREERPLIVPGKAQESRLFLMLTGKAEPAMPLDNHSLSKMELGVIRRWINAGARPPHLYIKPPKQDLKRIFSMALSPDGNSFALGRDSYIDFIVPGTQQSAILVGQTDAEITGLDFSKDGRFLACAGGEVRVWDLVQHRPVLTRAGEYKAVAISPDGTLLAAGTDLVEVPSGKLLRIIEGPVDAVRFSADGRQLITASTATGKIQTWDPATGQLLNSVVQKALSAFPLSANEIQQLGTVGTGQAVPIRPSRVSWSRDSTRIAVATKDRTVRVFRVSDGKELFTWADQSDEVVGLQFTYDGRALAIARLDGTFERRPLAAAPTVYSKYESHP